MLNCAALVLSALLFLYATSPAQTVNLKLIETSDVHGSLFPYDFINDREINSSLAQIYTYVKEQRNDKKQQVVLLDDGDILQGQPVVYYYNYEKTDVPHICASVMNYMKYDAATVGNHDIEPGHPVYDKIEKEFKFPWLAANAVKTATGKPYFKPYAIIYRKGIKIAVLGLITPWIPNWLPEKIWSGMRFDDMVETAKKWVKIIKEKEKPDLLIGLFHSGVETNYNGQTSNTFKNENASALVAREVPGFDVVFVGHDHHGWDFTVKNPEGQNVLILGTINAARTATEADIQMTFDKKTGKWEKDITGKVIQSKDYKPDPAYMKKFSGVIKEVKEYVSKPIGKFTKTISTRESLFGDSPFVDLIQKIQLEISGADVSFAAPLSFNASIKEGTVYRSDMFKLYKYENLLYTMKMNGKEIKDYLEFSYAKWFNTMKDSLDHLLNFKTDANGNLELRNGKAELSARYYNFSSAAGINYTVDVTKPAGNRIKILSMADGSPFDMNKIYKVAVNSYRGMGGGGHVIQGAKIPKDEIQGRIINSTQKDLRYYLMKWIERNKTVTPEKLNNWKVIPESWWKLGREKDYKVLFSN